MPLGVTHEATPGRDLQRIYQRVLYDKLRFEQLEPLEKPSLYEVLRGKMCIRLASGDMHCFDRREVLELARSIPWYMHKLVKLPIMLTYHRDEWGSYFKLRGDSWCARALSALVGGNALLEKYRLTVTEAETLLARFKTLVFVSIEFNVEVKQVGGDEERV